MATGENRDLIGLVAISPRRAPWLVREPGARHIPVTRLLSSYHQEPRAHAPW